MSDVGRVGGLAAALGVGAWLAVVPWAASADTGSAVVDAAGFDPSVLLSSTPTDSAGIDFAVSYDGMTLIQDGNAVAESGTGSWAIAYGDGAVADAGYGQTAGGQSLVSAGDAAIANGAGSTAIAGGTGGDDTAFASDGGSAYAGFDPNGPTSSVLATHDSATATGTGSVADAAGQGFNTADAANGGTADAGYASDVTDGANGGTGDYASANGADSVAAAGYGNNDIADVFGTNSHAIAGGILAEDTFAPQSGDLADAFGNTLSANASGASNIFDIEPGGFTNIATDALTAATPADDLGLTTILTDLSTLGLNF